MEATAEFPADLAAAAAARHFAEEHLAAWGAEALLETTRLLVSELVINAVLHARTPSTVHLTYNGRCLRVVVIDGSRRVLAPRQASPRATTGRGLMILDALSNRWGVETQADGKRVWFELDAEAAALDRADASARAHTPSGERTGEAMVRAAEGGPR